MRVGRRSIMAVAVVAGLGVGLTTAFVIAGTGGTDGPRRTPTVKELKLPGRHAPAPTTRTDDPTPVAAPTPRAAVEQFLAAEADGRDADGWALLDGPSRMAIGSVASWVAAQPDRLQPTSFTVQGEQPSSDGVDVDVTVTHRPTLDAFAGLVPGRTHQRLHTVPVPGGWQVDADPVEIDPLYPADAAAPAAVGQWLDELTACDTRAAARLEAGADVVGSPYYLQRPCAEKGTWRAGRVTRISGGVGEPLVNEFGPDVDQWGRLVEIVGPKTRFYAAMAPIGDAWRVMGVLADDGRIGG